LPVFRNEQDRAVSRLTLFSIGIVAIGLVFLAIGADKAWTTYRSLPDSQRVEGKVIELQKTQGSRGTLYSPVFEYEVDKAIYRVRGKSASSSPEYKAGDKVTVVYPRGKPGDGVIDSFAELWLPSIAYAACGVLFGFVALGIRWWARRRKSRPSPGETK
jgi:hypothetical protein